MKPQGLNQQKENSQKNSGS